MGNLSEFLTSIANEMGVNTDDESIKEFFENLPDTELPEGFAGFNDTYFTLDSAKNHKDIATFYKSKLKGQYLGNADRITEQALKNFPIDEEVLAEIGSEEDTQNKLRKAFEAIQGLYDNKGASSDEKVKEREQELLDKVQTLQAEISKAYEEKDLALNEQAQQFDQERLNTEMIKTLSDLPISESFSREDVNLLINTKYKDSDYIFKRGENGWGVYMKEDPDIEAYKDNKKLKIDDVITELAQPYLKKSDAPPTETPPKKEGDTPKQSGATDYTFGATHKPLA